MKLTELKSQGHLSRAGVMACPVEADTIESQKCQE